MDPSTSKPAGSDAALAFVILGLGCFLAFTGAGLLEQWQHSASRRQSLAFEDLLGFVAAAAGLVIVAWWVLSLAAAFAAALLERSGRRRAAAVSRRLSPAFMRRLALGVLGMQLVAAPLAHADASQGPGLVPSHTVALSAAWAPTHDQCADKPVLSPVSLALATEPAQEGLATGPVVAGTSDVRPQWQASPPVPAPRFVTSAPARAANELPSRRELVVRSGDSLWTIAARHLGPEATDVEIAREWPRWFAVNSAVIGSSPDLLLPGQILRAP
ncbi:putative membrane protein [Arthrobacter pascens]|uniref:LysM peptidoglycan-binding domain-containing protein n=1 Tax=Arthrobacter pascens TaxID=1677 RepID=UPI00285F2A88|nr:LysM peptidoglycan-binding domain-containing protein [Arthrobacter pascens]MDR6556223.1 putative membrane protein [Arthrobacter pascens]